MRFSLVSAICVLAMSCAAPYVYGGTVEDIARLVETYNERARDYERDRDSAVGRAIELFNTKFGSLRSTTIRSLENQARKTGRDGDIAAQGRCYRMILLIDRDHEDAREHFDALGRLDEILKSLDEDNTVHETAVSGVVSRQEVYEAYLKLLAVDPENRDAVGYFRKRNQLDEARRDLAKRKRPPHDAIEWNDHHYKLISERLTWYQAKQWCATNGGYLIRIESIDEMRFVSRLTNQMPQLPKTCWIDGSDVGKEGTWVFSNAEPMRFFNWNGREPSNHQDFEHHIEMYTRGDGVWNDVPGDKRLYFICEWDH